MAFRFYYFIYHYARTITYSMTYRSLSLVAFLSISAFTLAQNKEYTPEDTEVWEPVPEVVSPGETDDQPPADATVLFGGNNLDAWVIPDDTEWDVHDGIVTVVPSEEKKQVPTAIRTKEAFGDMQLHLEWRAPAEIEGEGQRRGNSGILIQGRYELQIQDCYDNPTYVNGQAAAIYKQHAPLVNACREPGEWQTYDVFYTAPTFDEIGIVQTPAYITVVHNGILVQNHTEIKGRIKHVGLPSYEPHGKEPIFLQDHGNPVSFRNIWVRKIEGD